MRIVIILTAFVFTYTNILAQGIPVSHSVEKRNVILEDFTGIYCVNCPNGHYYANLLKENNPGDVALIMVHTGGYAAPTGSDPDFRTQFGSALENASDLTGYPSATINRHLFASLGDGGTAIVNRGNWATAANQILAENSIVNLGVEAEIDVQSGLLTGRVQLYYTGNPTYPTNNRIHVAILQDDLEGPQTGMANNPDQVLPNGKYLHKHVLRHLIIGAGTQNGQTGFKIPFTVGAGMTVDTSFAYALPDDIRDIPLKLSKLKVVAFINDGSEIVTGHEITPTFINFPGTHSSKVLSAAVENNAVCGFTTAPAVTIQNFGSSPLTSLYIDYSINESPTKSMYWTGNIPSMGEEQITLNDINYFASTSNELTVTTRLPNGNNDPETSDDETTLTFNSAPDVSDEVTMTLQLDYYGAEVSWELLNSAGTELYSGGPYTNTANPNSTPPLPAPITATFSLDPDECYEFKITDSYGDGILGTNTGFTLKDDQNVTLVSNYAKYGANGIVLFGVNQPKADSTDVFPPTTGILSPEVGGIKVYPNPACDMLNVDFGFTNEQASFVYITDMLGKRVQTISENGKLTGFVQVSVADFTPGIYFLHAEVAGNRYMQKVLVSR